MSNKKRWIICGLLAGVLIGLGLYQGIMGIEFNRQIMYYVELGIMFGVFYLLVIYPRQTKKEKTNKEHIEKES